MIREIQYRFNYIAGTLIELSWAALRVVFYLVTFSHVLKVGTWTEGKSLVLTGTFLLVQAIFKVIFENNFMNFPHVLHNGELDSILVKPISAQFLATTRSVSPMSIARIFLSSSVIIIGLISYGWIFSLISIVSFLYALLLSLLIMYSIHFIGFCLLFWLGYVDNIHFMTRIFVGQSYIPVDIFPKIISDIFIFIIPLAFIAMIPTQALFSNKLGLLCVGTAIGGAMYMGSRWMWHKGLKNYSSVSS